MNVTRFINVRQTRQTGHLSRQTGHFRCKNGTALYLWICSKSFLKILPNESSQEVHGNYINGFFEEKDLI